MTAAPPLLGDDEDLNIRPLDLAACDPEEREAIEAALARVADGTTQPVPHAEVVRKVEEKRRHHDARRG